MVRLLLIFLLTPAFASAQTRRIRMLESYDAEVFAAHQEEGRTIVIQFHSESCGLCTQQEKVLKKISRQKDPTTPSFFQATLGVHSSLAMLYGAKPSTILVFRGKRLVGRETGVANANALRGLIVRSVMKSRGLPRPRPKRKIIPKR